MTNMSETQEETTEHLFSYGTLQTQAVQTETFGRLLEGKKESLPGYELTMIAINDPAVVETSGEAHHPIITPTGRAADMVHGTVFKITPKELADADRYEVDAYKRVRVIMSSGQSAWAYIDATAEIHQKSA